VAPWPKERLSDCSSLYDLFFQPFAPAKEEPSKRQSFSLSIYTTEFSCFKHIPVFRGLLHWLFCLKGNLFYKDIFRLCFVCNVCVFLIFAEAHVRRLRLEKMLAITPQHSGTITLRVLRWSSDSFGFYTLFQNGRHFSMLLFAYKLALVASFLSWKFKRIFYLGRGNKG